ncbi:MAG: GNAT family N-acetyltransferase [Xanthomonadaceae bacterium]|nr:GNAT family N-acetyltransferase [Xanthomonadaceae bacterium]MDE1884765.1 GNAT family N-acetyltransferase [Xanthomonadaceae bacterium]MDE1961507.1 GNAT family N-acetyltransferase [Xanthomonadaceae bacterium]MDE2084153.1 GNAT family N-acetyltransferase [Xanthomonadaceae bacterium]MDE2257651.1 GNAT family N-acetyltransferase [Xanthomonadaceae bacterium]
MPDTELDNPVWSALTSGHAGIALRKENAARYPAQVAPFVAVDPADALALVQLASLVDVGETVLFVGPAPSLDSNWSVVEPLVHIAQMVCAARLPVNDGPEVIKLSAAHRADVLDLTARVYPHYFRPRTMDLGRYFGIYDGAKLAALAGERMRLHGHTELSAICTDPAYVGRGYAQRLTALLTNDLLERGVRPFLHVSHANTRAKTLYERMGYRFRADVPLLAVRRVALPD